MQYWEKLLVAWREQGRNGLTIPFLIGSQQYLPNAWIHSTPSELLTDVVQQASHKVFLTYCMDIKGLILGIKEGQHGEIAGYYPTFKTQYQHRLYVSSFLANHGKSVESVSAALDESLQDQIDSQTYSSSETGKRPYNNLETAFIVSTFSSYQA